MKLRMHPVVGIWLALFWAVPTPAFAQSQAQQDRLNRVAQYIVTAPMCGRLGMNLDPELPTKAATAFMTEVISWHGDTDKFEQLMVESISRQGTILTTDLETASAGMKTSVQLRAVKNNLLGYGRTCLDASTDPIFSSLIELPLGYDLEKAATEAADSVLEAGGLASWQTPSIQARGDLMMIAGACRSKIGAARSDALFNEFAQSDDPRVRNYYLKSFDEGLSDPTLISTLAGCNRAISVYRAKLH